MCLDVSVFLARRDPGPWITNWNHWILENEPQIPAESASGDQAGGINLASGTVCAKPSETLMCQ